MSIDIKKLLPSNLNSDFWNDYSDSWTTELGLVKTEKLDAEKYYFYIRTQTDIDKLIDICRTFGFKIDRSIDTTIDFSQRETKLILYKIKDKSTYNGYDLVFVSIQYPGLVYNYYYDRNTVLIKAIDCTLSCTNLDNQDYSEPFIGYIPDYHFFPLAKNNTLDLGKYLDATPLEYLDLAYRQAPTHHIGIEYTPKVLLTDDDGNDAYMLSKYLDYLNNGVEYNRKVTEVPHVGFQLNLITDLSGYYNNLSLDTTYTVPVLKMQNALTIQNVYRNITPIFLDATETENLMDLDQEQPFQLDQDIINPNLTGDLDFDFNTVIAGDGGVGSMSKDFPEINENLIAYWSFDESGGAIFEDLTANAYNGTLTGTYSRAFTMLNQGIVLDGFSAYGVSNNIKFDADSKTITFWMRVNANNYVNTSEIYLDSAIPASKMDLDSTTPWNLDQEIISPFAEVPIMFFDDYIKILFNKPDQLIKVQYNDQGSGTKEVSSEITADGSLIFVAITVDTDSQEMKLYINNVLADTIAFDNINSGFFDYYLGTDSGLSLLFQGTLDEIRVYGIKLTEAEIGFLYTDRLANIGAINIIKQNSDLITIKEEKDNWYIISGRLVFDDPGDNPEDEVTISELGFKNSSGIYVAYASFPPAVFRKKYHLNYNLAIKK